ncbi:MAG: DUF1254 domain-containing protein [Anaerolineae bacterium]|nr:DUF1254 domain-containing protein [Anaerolineae bacterium]
MTYQIDPQEAFDIGIEAYIYLYPLITMDVTRRVMTNVPANAVPGMGPAGAFYHMRAFPDANFKAVVRPNFDTLYSSAWLDLTREPVIVSVPDTQGRYYLLPILDMWTDAFAVPGTRTSGNDAGHFAIVREGWTGTLPEGVQKIESPTPYVWVIGRTQTNGPADYTAVHQLQDNYLLTPLSQWPNPPQPPVFSPDPSVDMKTPPLYQVHNMSAQTYFTYGAELMKLHPPHKTDWSQIARRRRVGLRAGELFAWEKLSPAVQEALNAAPAAAIKMMEAKLPTMAKVVNGWQMNTDTMGVYGDYYLKRAIVTMVGLGANQAVDAIYPLSVVDADGRPYDGAHQYVLHFEKEELPPAAAFWSITMYDHEGFQCANEINRFAIGDRDNLTFNADGSLDIYLQHEHPGNERLSNWLPSPAGAWNVCMRLYAPRPQALDGRWNPPAVKRVE